MLSAFLFYKNGLCSSSSETMFTWILYSFFLFFHLWNLWNDYDRNCACTDFMHKTFVTVNTQRKPIKKNVLFQCNKENVMFKVEDNRARAKWSMGYFWRLSNWTSHCFFSFQITIRFKHWLSNSKTDYIWMFFGPKISKKKKNEKNYRNWNAWNYFQFSSFFRSVFFPLFFHFTHHRCWAESIEWK